MLLGAVYLVVEMVRIRRHTSATWGLLRTTSASSAEPLSPGGTARRSTTLDARLAAYLVAFLACQVPAIVDSVMLTLATAGATNLYSPFALLLTRWTLQPLQGFFNAAVYWRHSDVSVHHLRRLFRRRRPTGLADSW